MRWSILPIILLAGCTNDLQDNRKPYFPPLKEENIEFDYDENRPIIIYEPSPDPQEDPYLPEIKNETE